MTFEEFWKQNRDRYKAMAEIESYSVFLAIHTAAEEAWDIAQSNTIAIEASDD